MKEITLLPHNQDIVAQIEQAMVFGNHKIFYTEATGLGKSFVFMYLVNKYFKDKKVLYICPKNCIWTNMQSYEEFELIKDCVTMMCNADFNEIKERHFGYDAIFIDEAHHLTAPVQGENIMKVADMTLETNPNAYIFGFTATPYVDDIFIGDEYFQKSIVGMDLCAAIDAGILQKINYAIAINDEIILSQEEKNAIIKYDIDSTANTTRGIIDQYASVNHWLVYFPFIDELEENITYFETHFPEFKLFIIHSNVEDCDAVIREFDTYDGKAFLLSVSMVLEGVHIRSVEGVLLYRNLTSDITLLQIIGRLGTTNINKNPIFVDIYNSYNIFLRSNIVRKSETSYSHDYDRVKNYIYMSSNTYEFIEISRVISSMRLASEQQVYEYHDITWTSIKDLAIKLNTTDTTIYRYLNQGKTIEQIIDMIRNGEIRLNQRRPREFSCEYEGIVYTSVRDFAKKLGISDATIWRHIDKGKTIEQIIDMAHNSEFKRTFVTGEYKDIVYTSIGDLSDKLGVPISTIYTYRKQGKTIEQIIDMVRNGEIERVRRRITGEYEGIVYTNIKDLANKLNTTDGTIRKYLNQGKTIEQIIDMIRNGEIRMNHITGEYAGIVYTNIKDLAKKLGINTSTIHKYRNQGKTIEQIIDMVHSGEIVKRK